MAVVTDNGYVYTSNDYGVVWSKTNAPEQDWSCVASDDSGIYQL